MAFFNNLFNNLRSDRDAPALPQIGALPQVTPVKQLTGIGSMLPMQTITLPGGQTVQIPQLNMEEINANLLAAGITPQTPLPNITPEVATPTPSLPVAAPSLPVAPPSFRTADFQDGNGNGIDDRDEPVTTPAPVDTVGAGFDPTQGRTLTPPVEQQLAPYTGAGYDAFGEQPFVSGVI